MRSTRKQMFLFSAEFEHRSTWPWKPLAAILQAQENRTPSEEAELGERWVGQKNWALDTFSENMGSRRH